MFRHFRRFTRSKELHWQNSNPRTSWVVTLMIHLLVAAGVAIAGGHAIAAEPPLAALSDAGASGADVLPERARQFVADTCGRCHNPKRNIAHLDLTHLAYDPDDRGNLALWVKVHDRVSAGEMPPEDAPQPEAEARKGFVGELAQTFIKSERRQMNGEGRRFSGG